MVISVVWMLGASVFAWDIYSEYEAEHAEIARLKCMLDFDRNPGATLEASTCAQSARDEHSRRLRLMWRKIIFISIVPVAFAWTGAVVAGKVRTHGM